MWSAPFDIASLSGIPYYVVFFAIGVGFGAILEMSGFGDSRKLAAQFYLKDMTVLKVMFTAIVTAAVLLGIAHAFGWIELTRVWINPTFLPSQIVGGLIMGVGFIIGGFCPGTSVVAAATWKKDGLAFVLGVLIGTMVFSEHAPSLVAFQQAGAMGRFTLPQWFGLSYGATLLILVGFALAAFYFAELSEAVFGKGAALSKPLLSLRSPRKLAAATALMAGAATVAFAGDPDPAIHWQKVAQERAMSLKKRDPFVHPAEVVQWKKDSNAFVHILDVRSAQDFETFHLLGAQHVTDAMLRNASYLESLRTLEPNTLFFVVSNGERRAVEAWKRLVGARVPNVYIIAGGMNHWLRIYPPSPCIAEKITPAPKDEEKLAWAFRAAVGHRDYAAHPEAPYAELPTLCDREATEGEDGAPPVRPIPFDPQAQHAYTPKVRLKAARTVIGGCG